MRARREREQRVVAPPPLIYFAGLVIGVVLDMLLPISALDRSDFASAAQETGPRVALGLAVFVAGAALNFSAVRQFREAETTVLPWGKPSRLVTSGPYRTSRNPMYVGLTLGYVGLAIVVGSVWAVLLLPIALVVMVMGVIRREEAYLARRFGLQYEEYRARVRRWL